MGPIKHFFHEHQLSYNTKYQCGISTRCYLCNGNVADGDYFYCKHCEIHEKDFVLHRRCAEQAEEIVHPRHPGHRLKLHRRGNAQAPLLYCNACWKPLHGPFQYYCFHCSDFNLHLSCAMLEDQQGMFKKKVSLKLPYHQHDLILYENKTREKCGWCRKDIWPDSNIYACHDCWVYLHEACMFQVLQLPNRIRHPFHEPHSLRLSIGKNKCLACGGHCFKKICYACEDCGDIELHGYCTSFLPTFKSKHHHHC